MVANFFVFVNSFKNVIIACLFGGAAFLSYWKIDNRLLVLERDSRFKNIDDRCNQVEMKLNADHLYFNERVSEINDMILATGNKIEMLFNDLASMKGNFVTLSYLGGEIDSLVGKKLEEYIKKEELDRFINSHDFDTILGGVIIKNKAFQEVFDRLKNIEDELGVLRKKLDDFTIIRRNSVGNNAIYQKNIDKGESGGPLIGNGGYGNDVDTADEGNISVNDITNDNKKEYENAFTPKLSAGGNEPEPASMYMNKIVTNEVTPPMLAAGDDESISTSTDDEVAPIPAAGSDITNTPIDVEKSVNTEESEEEDEIAYDIDDDMGNIDNMANDLEPGIDGDEGYYENVFNNYDVNQEKEGQLERPEEVAPDCDNNSEEIKNIVYSLEQVKKECSVIRKIIPSSKDYYVFKMQFLFDFFPFFLKKFLPGAKVAMPVVRLNFLQKGINENDKSINMLDKSGEMQDVQSGDSLRIRCVFFVNSPFVRIFPLISYSALFYTIEPKAGGVAQDFYTSPVMFSLSVLRFFETRRMFLDLSLNIDYPDSLPDNTVLEICRNFISHLKGNHLKLLGLSFGLKLGAIAFAFFTISYRDFELSYVGNEGQKSFGKKMFFSRLLSNLRLGFNLLEFSI